MTVKPLTCTRCGDPVELVEEVIGCLDWGPVVIGDDGIIRPADPNWLPPLLTADNAEATGKPRACCTNRKCGHQWRVRRRFLPTA